MRAEEQSRPELHRFLKDTDMIINMLNIKNEDVPQSMSILSGKTKVDLFLNQNKMVKPFSKFSRNTADAPNQSLTFQKLQFPSGKNDCNVQPLLPQMPPWQNYWSENCPETL